jgi:hypothetical protein
MTCSNVYAPKFLQTTKKKTRIEEDEAKQGAIKSGEKEKKVRTCPRTGRVPARLFHLFPTTTSKTKFSRIRDTCGPNEMLNKRENTREKGKYKNLSLERCLHLF